MTKVLVISDVHANITALEAVLADAGKVNEIWCLGDIAGYGPDPNECIERIQALPKLTCMMGNHDYAAIGDMALETFNLDAKRLCYGNTRSLTDASKDFLRTLSQKPRVCGSVTLAHGSPRDPIWEYIMNTLVARINMDFFETLWCFVGHSHFQAVFQYHAESDEVTIEVPRPAEHYELKERAILNPGSVGQPRDRDHGQPIACSTPKPKPGSLAGWNMMLNLCRSVSWMPAFRRGTLSGWQ